MGDVAELDGVMRHLREAVRDNEFVEWALVGTTADDMVYVGYSPADIERSFWLLHKGATILQDLDIPEEMGDA